MNIKSVIITVFLLVSLSGCISSKSYVDPKYHHTSYSDIKLVQERHYINLIVEFQRNGKHLSKHDTDVHGFVERAFRATAVIVPDRASQNRKVKVIVNNLADLGNATAKGFGVGLTFGAAGTVVTDYYEITIEYSNGSDKIVKNLQHALHTTIGNKAAPIENVEPTTALDGFGKIIEDAVLNFVKDMQDQGYFTLNSQLPKRVV